MPDLRTKNTILYLENGQKLESNDMYEVEAGKWSNPNMAASIFCNQTVASWTNLYWRPEHKVQYHIEGGAVIELLAVMYGSNRTFAFDIYYPDGTTLLHDDAGAGYSSFSVPEDGDERGIGIRYNLGKNSFTFLSFYDRKMKWSASFMPEPETIYHVDFKGIDPTYDFGIYGNMRVWDYYFDEIFVTPSTDVNYNFNKLTNNGQALGEPDSNDQGGTSGAGGGGGHFDDSSDPIPVPALPTKDGLGTGLVYLATPSNSQILGLASYLWEFHLDLVEAIKKMFANPMDVIINFGILPLDLTGTASPLSIVGISTGLTMNRLNSQYVEVDCGTIHVDEYWGSALDYAPFTKIQLYIPYLGVVDLSTDDVMDVDINIKYHVDCLTGSFTCFVSCGNAVLYTFNGNMMSPLPVTAGPYVEMFKAGLSAIGNITMAAASGGGSAVGGALAEGAEQVTTSAIANVVSSPVAAAAFNGASSVLSAKSNVQKSNSIGETSGYMGIKYPYLIITRPAQSLPQGYKKMCGYPSNITRSVGSLEGYTEIDKIHLEAVEGAERIQQASLTELNELESILKGGFIA